MTMVPQYSQLLDILGIMQSGVMSKAMTIDQALADGQTRAEAAMATAEGAALSATDGAPAPPPGSFR